MRRKNMRGGTGQAQQAGPEEELQKLRLEIAALKEALKLKQRQSGAHNYKFGDEVKLTREIQHGNDKLPIGLQGVVISNPGDDLEVGMFPMVFSDTDMRKIFHRLAKLNVGATVTVIGEKHSDKTVVQIVRDEHEGTVDPMQIFQGAYTDATSSFHLGLTGTIYNKWTPKNWGPKKPNDWSRTSIADTLMPFSNPVYWGVCMGRYKVNTSDIISTSLQGDNVGRMYEWRIDNKIKGRATWPRDIGNEKKYTAEMKKPE